MPRLLPLAQAAWIGGILVLGLRFRPTVAFSLLAPSLSQGIQPNSPAFASNHSPEDNLMDLLVPQPSCDVTQMSGTDLAYIGDVVFEIFVRSRYVWPPKRTAQLQTTVVECVRGTLRSFLVRSIQSSLSQNPREAENQSMLLAKLKEEFPLSPKEQKVVSRGRNAVTRSRNRRDPATYQDSTAFEALLGYLYIVDKERCKELLIWLETQLKES